jgi:hypothetical protein
MITNTYQQAIAARDAAAHALYEAELAVHDAHQTGVDEWISAAHRHLHNAIVQHSAAINSVAVFELAA